MIHLKELGVAKIKVSFEEGTICVYTIGVKEPTLKVTGATFKNRLDKFNKVEINGGEVTFDNSGSSLSDIHNFIIELFNYLNFYMKDKKSNERKQILSSVLTKIEETFKK